MLDICRPGRLMASGPAVLKDQVTAGLGGAMTLRSGSSPAT
jgi:hypothetical protein